MPFRSTAQQRYLYAKHPDVAARFAAYGARNDLPKRVRKRRAPKASRA